MHKRFWLKKTDHKGKLYRVALAGRNHHVQASSQQPYLMLSVVAGGDTVYFCVARIKKRLCQLESATTLYWIQKPILDHFFRGIRWKLQYIKTRWRCWELIAIRGNRHPLNCKGRIHASKSERRRPLTARHKPQEVCSLMIVKWWNNPPKPSNLTVKDCVATC